MGWGETLVTFIVQLKYPEAEFTEFLGFPCEREWLEQCLKPNK